MSISYTRKKDVGQPTTNGGHFAAEAKAEPSSLTLSPDTDPILDALNGWEPSEDFSIPQANDLDKVMVVVSGIKDGANTHESAGEMIDANDRTGGYYCSAAGYLGLVSQSKDEWDISTYETTDLGDFFLELDDDQRCAMISTMVNRMDDVTLHREKGVEELERVYSLYSDLSDSTASRRAACISSWSNQALNVRALQVTLADSSAESQQRSASAIAMAIQQRDAARKVAAAKTPTVGDFCPSCFVQMPVTNRCDNCD